MKKFILFSFFIFVEIVMGNGGGYQYGTDFTGAISPFTSEGTESVQILDEKLDILLGEESAKVSVLYQMKNVTDKKVVVKFGFPVEDVKNFWGYRPEEKKPNPIDVSYTKNYVVKVNGKTIKHSYVHEPFGADKKKGLKPFKGSEILKDIKGWQVSKISLAKGETISLQIVYDSQYDERFSSVSDDSRTSPLLFKYRLSTGAVWHGPIVKGRITLSLGETLNPQEVRVMKPVNCFKKVGQQYVWEFQNLEPTLADDLTIEARAGYNEYSAYADEDKPAVSYLNLGNKWYIYNVNYSLKATSALADEKKDRYSVKNLKKYWGDVWSEGVDGSGEAESITLKMNKPTKISGLTLKNGYAYNEDLFKKNNRVKKLEVLVNGQHKELLHLGDVSDERRYYLNYDQPVKSIKLTIQSVYKGTEFDDTCLSSLLLLERLEKEPNRYGAR